MVHEEREDERRRRGGWVVSSDLDPGNQVSSSQLHWHTFPRIYTVAGRSRPSTMTQPTTRRVTIARITSELSRPRQPVNRGRVTVIIETLLRDRSRRMESRPIPWSWWCEMQLDGISFFLPPITTILRILFPFFDLILILDSAWKWFVARRWSWFRFWVFGWSVSRNLAFRG